MCEERACHLDTGRAADLAEVVQDNAFHAFEIFWRVQVVHV